MVTPMKSDNKFNSSSCPQPTARTRDLDDHVTHDEDAEATRLEMAVSVVALVTLCNAAKINLPNTLGSPSSGDGPPSYRSSPHTLNENLALSSNFINPM